MSKRRRSLRIARHGVLRSASVVLILAASLVGLLRLSLPWLAAQPGLVATMLAEAVKTPVQLQQVDARWSAAGPILTLHQLQFGDQLEGETLDVGRAEVQVDLLGGLLPGRRWIRELVIDDVALALTHSDGRWTVSGLPLEPPRADAGERRLALLERLGAVRLRAVNLTLHAPTLGVQLQAPPGDLLLARQDGALQLGIALGGGELGTLHLAVHPTADLRSGRAYLQATELDLSGWRQAFVGTTVEPRGGVVNAELWLDWDDGQARAADGWVEMAGVAVGGGTPLQLKDVGDVDALAALPDGRLELQLRDGGAALEGGLWWQSADAEQPVALLSAQLSTVNHSADIYLYESELAPLADLLTVVDRVPGKARAALYSMDPRGRVDILHLHNPGDGRWWLQAELSGVGYNSDPNRWPGASGLALQLMADADGVWAGSRPTAIDVEWRQAWPEVIAIEDLRYALSAAPDENGWLLQFERAEVNYAGVTGKARGQVSFVRGEPPVLQMEAAASGPIAPSRQFWVATKMSPKAISWLEQALDNGRLLGASMYYRGPPKRWPFKGAEGRFLLDMQADQLELDYHPDWPPATGLSARARIINRGLYVDHAEGQVAGVPGTASGRIASFRKALLELQIAGAGDAGDLLTLLKQSPLQHTRGSLFIGMEASGATEGQAKLSIPLRQGDERSELDGKLELDGVDFRDAKWTVSLKDVRGAASFSLQGFSAPELSVQVGSERADLALAMGPYTANHEHLFAASMSGTLQAKEMFADYPPLAPIIGRFRGSSHWQGELHTTDDGTTLRYESDLVGTEIDLPAPLRKSPETAKPLSLEGRFGEQAPPQFDLRLGADVRLAAQLAGPDAPFSANLRFGGDAPEPPGEVGLSIDGHAPVVDISGWAGWLGQLVAVGVSDVEFNRLDLATEQLALMGGFVPVERIQLGQTERGWQASVSGEQLAGSIDLDQERDGLALVANFERMHLPAGSGDTPSPTTVNPRWLPAVHLLIDDFAMGEANLGEVRVEAFSTAEGLRFDQLQARSEHLDLVGSGIWKVDPDGYSSSEFDLRFTAEDLGRMLAALGFSAPVEGGQTLAAIDARWGGSPLDFQLERLEGTLEVSVGAGRLVEVQPGAGRVFGLFSIRDLPRRLSLDFSDVFTSGLSFNEISGVFQLAEGNAWTQDLKLLGPAADIEIIGRTGLAVRDYDQQILVAPRVGGAIPVVGALAGGPVGAAAGLLVQGVVGRGIEGANRYRYSVMGSWENPKVVRDDRALTTDAGDG